MPILRTVQLTHSEIGQTPPFRHLVPVSIPSGIRMAGSFTSACLGEGSPVKLPSATRLKVFARAFRATQVDDEVVTSSASTWLIGSSCQRYLRMTSPKSSQAVKGVKTPVASSRKSMRTTKQAATLAAMLALYKHACLSAMKLAGVPNNPVRIRDDATADELRADIMKHRRVLLDGDIIDLEELSALKRRTAN
jgi:hypothetical protein